MKIPKINLWAFGETFITHIFYYCGCGKYVPNGITAPTCWWSEDLMPRMAFCSYRKRPSSRDHGSFRRLAQGPITITGYTFTIKSTASTAALFALNRSVFSERFVKYRLRWPILKRLIDYLIGKSLWCQSPWVVGSLVSVSRRHGLKLLWYYWQKAYKLWRW